MPVKLLTFSLKYKLFVLANKENADLVFTRSNLVHIRTSVMTIERPTSRPTPLTWNLDDFDSALLRHNTRVIQNLRAE